MGQTIAAGDRGFLVTKPNTAQAIWAREVAYAESGITLNFESSWGEGELHAPLIGEFNACNLLLALATLLSLGFEKSALLATAPKLRPVLGRMELFQREQKPKWWSIMRTRRTL